jgi:hypothetical protein
MKRRIRREWRALYTDGTGRETTVDDQDFHALQREQFRTLTERLQHLRGEEGQEHFAALAEAFRELADAARGSTTAARNSFTDSSRQHRRWRHRYRGTCCGISAPSACTSCRMTRSSDSRRLTRRDVRRRIAASAMTGPVPATVPRRCSRGAGWTHFGRPSIRGFCLLDAGVGRPYNARLLTRSSTSPSSSGLGHRPFTAGTGVRTP